jgi:hypothetical protein
MGRMESKRKRNGQEKKQFRRTLDRERVTHAAACWVSMLVLSGGSSRTGGAHVCCDGGWCSLPAGRRWPAAAC